MQIQPYLFFDGRCAEAIAFYGQALGAKVLMLMHFGDAPANAGGGDGSPPPPADKVMHACLQIGESQLLVSDGYARGQPQFEGVSLSLSATDDAEARHLFDALARGGQVRVPLGPSFFASSFGMLTDQFGLGWMIIAGAMHTA
jgi:PhnB protein